MNPESLRAYARVGPGGFTSWLAAAERAVVDARQTANLARLDNAASMIAIHGDFGPHIGARAQAVLDAQDEQDDAPSAAAGAPASGASPPASTLPALTPAACVGREVCVPRHLWPSAPCRELDGAGWHGKVIAYHSPFAEVRLLHATTPGGTPYEPVKLRLDVLRPLD